MPYIGNSPGTGTRNRFIYTATASQTTFSGADDNGKTLKYADSDYVDVYLNGICLVPVTDYTSTSKTSIVLTQAASLNDTLEVVAYDIATISDTVSKADGGTFDGNIKIATTSGPQLSIQDTDNGFDATTLQVENGGRDLDITVPQDIIFTSGSDEAMRVLSGGKIGIGTSSPNGPLEVRGVGASASDNFEVGSITADFGSATTNDSFGGYLSFRHRTGGNLLVEPARIGVIGKSNNEGSLVFYGGGGTSSFNAPTEKVRINQAGNMLVGKTNDSDANAGVRVRGDGLLQATRDGADPISGNRLSSDGDVIAIRRDGSLVGSIGAYSSGIYVATTDGSDAGLGFRSNQLVPCTTTGGNRDNVIDLGASGSRFDDIFATNSTIQTSDENEKQQIASLTDAEMTAAKAISKLFKTFKWNDKVEAKGDAARTHIGVIAQQVETAMSDAGLDASKYAFWCSDTWWETQTEVAAVEADEENGIEAQDAYTRTDTYDTQEDAPEGATERNRKGIRYPELLAFIGAATEQRLTSIEARLDALEAG